MRTISILLLTVFVTVSSFCQETNLLSGNKLQQETRSMERVAQAGLDFPDYPQLILTEKSRDITLPAVHDNSHQPYLRPVFSQQGACCGQSASVAYNFCYEINRLRNLTSDTSTNQYTDHFVWNFMNATTPYYGAGVSYLHTFDILYDAGTPTEDVYGPITMNDDYYWMSGYEGYFQAMHNRISGVNSIHAGTPEGLIVLKHWLHNHLDGSAVGGVANYYAGMPFDPPLLPAGTPEAGKHVQIGFQEHASHALTIVGYNDSIRYDLNGDGLYTNNIDITGDGITDMKDWEIGGLKYVNSYGETWADSGFCYMLYSTLALKYGEGGIWNNSVHVLYPDTAYQPLLTIKARLKHTKRGRLKLLAGISSDSARYYPEHTMPFSIFNYQGGDYYPGGHKLESDKTLEFGLDITPLLNFIKPGSPARIFLIVDEKDPDNSADGMLLNYSVIDYLNPETAEYISTDTPISIVNNSRTSASVITNLDSNPLVIEPESTIIVNQQSATSVQFSASGGYPPYSWKLIQNYTETDSSAVFSSSAGNLLVPSDPETGFAAVPLPFEFPFFGELYDTLYMHVNGYLMFDQQDMPYYYLLFDEPYLQQIKAIAGYMHYRLALNSQQDYISMTSSEDKVVFNWHISANEGNSFAEFSISVFPDGQIKMHYGPSITETVYYPVTGISNGTKSETFYSKWNMKHIPEGKINGFVPADLPSGITLNENGLLGINPENRAFADNFIIQVTDAQRLQLREKVFATTGPEINISLADTPAILSPGSNIPLIVEIKNHSNQTISNLSLSLSSASDNAIVSGGIVNNIEILAGSAVSITDVFSLSIADSVSHPQIARVLAEAGLSNLKIRKYEDFPIDLPVLVVSPPVVIDGNNLTADPGEEVPLVFNIFNYGNATAGNIRTTLSIEEPYAAINGNPVIESGELKGYSKESITYMLKVNNAAPQGHIINLHIEVRPEHSPTLQSNFKLIIGKPVIALVDMDKNHNSVFHIALALKELNTELSLFESIDTSLMNYDIIFLSLGFFTQNHVLNQFEDSLFVAFLNQGGKLYLEGGTFFKQDPITELRSKLRVEGSNLAWAEPADTLVGIAGTPAEGIQFDYLGDWKRGENLLALSPSVPWFRDKNSELDFVVVLDSANYKTISSTVEFGGTFFFNGPGRAEFMRRYLDFLGYETEPLSAVFSADETNVCKGTTVNFDAASNGQSLTYEWEFEGGTPATWTGPLPRIKYETPGIFSASISVNNGTNYNSFTLHNLITVDNCTGVEDTVKARFTLYPNPASDLVVLEIREPGSREVKVTLTDVRGRQLFQLTSPGESNNILIPTNNLRAGMYIVRVATENWSASSKLIIN